MLKVEIVEQNAQPVLMIKKNTSIDQLPKIIGENYMKIFEYLNELEETPKDAPYTAYYNLDMQNLDVELGFPVSKVFPDKGEIKSGFIPQGKYATAMFKGPYSGMQEAYNEIFKWLGENGYEPAGVYYEHYYNSPEEVPESELLTKIVIPVKEKN